MTTQQVHTTQEVIHTVMNYQTIEIILTYQV